MYLSCPQAPKKLMRQSGFSLVELITVVALVAILASVSVPSYSKFVTREKIRTAQSDLHLLSLRIEHRYQRVLSYPDMGYNSTATLKAGLNFTNWIPTSETSDFEFSNDNASVTGYTIKATGVNGHIKDCVIAMTHDGTKTISNCASIAPDGRWI